MLDVDNIEKKLERRFNEIFLADVNSLNSEKSLDYFIARVADFFEYVNIHHKDFVNYFESKISIITEDLKADGEKIDLYLQIITPVISQLNENIEFLEIIKLGKKEHEDNYSRAHSLASNEICYQSFEGNLKLLLDKHKNTSIGLETVTSLTFEFKRLLYELKTLGKQHLVTNLDSLIKNTDETRQVIEMAKTKAGRTFDYSRISSYQQLKEIWNHLYHPDQFNAFSDLFGLRLHLAKEEQHGSLLSSRPQLTKLIDGIRIDVHRYNHALLDWLEEQNFIEMALKDFRIWAELVNNRSLVSLYEQLKSEKVREKETLLKDELSKYLFSSYRILAIREPDFKLKKPDFLTFTDNKIITEAKLIKDDFTQKGLNKTIEEGLGQIKSYSTLFPYVDAIVLLIFNFSPKYEMVFDVLISKISNKPLFILPININSRPSKTIKTVTYIEDLSEVLKKLGF